jgi:hypothetical protein
LGPFIAEEHDGVLGDFQYKAVHFEERACSPAGAAFESGLTMDCVSEPGAGSDVRGWSFTAAKYKNYFVKFICSIAFDDFAHGEFGSASTTHFLRRRIGHFYAEFGLACVTHRNNRTVGDSPHIYCFSCFGPVGLWLDPRGSRRPEPCRPHDLVSTLKQYRRFWICNILNPVSA